MGVDGNVCAECMPAFQALIGEVESLRETLAKLTEGHSGDEAWPIDDSDDRARQAEEPPLPQ
jgi:hypothetical protein